MTPMSAGDGGEGDGGGDYGAEHFTLEDVDSAAFVTARLVLTETRGISPATATKVLLTNECWACPCIINEPQGPDCTGCACHCECCCPPMSACLEECKCKCLCHFGGSDSDDIVPETSQSGTESAAESADVVAQAPAQGPTHPTSVGAATADGKQEGLSNGPAAHDEMDDNSGSDGTLSGEISDEAMSDGDGAAEERTTGEPDDAVMSDGRTTPAEGSDDDASTDGEDVVMTQVRLPDSATTSQLYAAIVNERAINATADNPRYDRLVRLFFKRAYEDAVPATMSKTKDDQLPLLEDAEVEVLKELLTVLLDIRKHNMSRLVGVLKEVAKASARSSWDLTKILKNRTASARIPDSAPANVWMNQSSSQTVVDTSSETQYVFDPAVYSIEESTDLKALCEQPHVFAETTRPPSPEEWKVIMGMINGTILAKALPQFLKRCATMAQVAWIHREVMFKAEGELWTKLPTLSKMYNYNQSSKRLIAELRTSATQYEFKDPRFEAMLSAVKVATYNHEMHSLHFHFFTKAAAAQWTGLTIPFRKSKLVLRNPDAEMVAATRIPGRMQSSSDKLVNDRYQANYKIRLTNITRTLDVSRLTKYLEQLTGDGVKTGVPLDSYGPNSEWSLTWDVYAKRPACPTKLENINRIMWDTHMIMLQHNPGQGRAPCLLCAQTGHQVAACTVAEADRYKTNTLIVTSAEIEQLYTPQPQWTTPEDALAVFTQMGATRTTTVEAPTTSSTDDSTSEPKGGNQDANHGDQGAGQGGGTLASAGGTITNTTDLGTPPKTGDSVETNGTQPGAAPLDAVGDGQALDEPNANSNPTRGKTAGGAAPSGSWITKSSKRSSNSSKAARASPAQQTEDRTSPQAAHAATGSAPKPTPHQQPDAGTSSANKFENLESEDDDDDASEADEVIDVTEATNGNPPAPGARTGKRPSPTGKPSAEPEEVVLDRAVAWARTEKLRGALNEHLRLYSRPFDATEPLAAIARALPNVAMKSSRPWILESVGGRLASTPMTGNCQPLALAEALHQAEIRGSANSDAMVETTMMGKLGMLHAAEHEVLDATLLTNVASILDNPEGTASAESPAEQQARARKFYKELALTGSALTDSLPKELWGGYDSLRMMSKMLNRRIYLISQFADKTNVHLNLMQPQLSKKGHPTCTMHQPGAKAWLETLAADLKTEADAPIILSYEGDHYNAVLLDRHIAPADRSTGTKLRSTSIPELWTSVTTSLDEMIDTAAKTARTTHAAGPTHAAVIRADARVTEDDLYAFLAQDNWTTAEKKELIAILVGGKLNYKEQLTAVVTPGGSDPEPSGGESSQSEAAASDESAWSEDDEPTADSSGASQAYSLSQPEDGEYREWADAMWESVTAVWEEQHNQPIPALTEGPALEKLARDDPPLVCELGRWCENPFVLLDHFSKKGIREWMESKRQEYIIRELTAVASRVVDASVKTVLQEWLTAAASLEMKLARVRLREEGMWDLLKQAAPQMFNKTTAPFLTRDYSTTSAYVFVLDELYPDLAGHALRNSGYMETEGSTLIDAYCRVPELRQVLKLAQGGKSWEPIERYLNSLRQHTSAKAGAHFYEPTKSRTTKTSPSFPHAAISGLLTQNVRGFRDVEQQRSTWFNGWKKTFGGRKVDCILLQETHVTSKLEADELATLWSRSWGKVVNPAQPLSFWSVTPDRRGGVAILLHPRVQGKYQEEPTHDPGRLLRLGSQDAVICNVYAPNHRGDREHFYRATSAALAGDAREVWLAGDFNCVLDPPVDRVTSGQAGRRSVESAALQDLIRTIKLTDVQAGSGQLELNRLTYWQGDSGARLDRCYTSRHCVRRVVGVDTITPHGPTDHRGVLVWTRDRECLPVQRKLQPNLYPIGARDPAAMEKTIGRELGTAMCAASNKNLGWDDVVDHVKETLLCIKRMERKRARRQLKRMKARQRKKIVTLRDLIAYVQQRAERKTQQRRGQQLLERSGQSEHLFKRFVQIDQRRPIPTLVATSTAIDESMAQADVMATAWQPLLCTTHTTVPPPDQRAISRRLYEIPAHHKLNAADNQQLLAPITEEEVIATIKTLGSHKAAGPDRLSNDFYRDWGELLVPRLTREFNSIMGGQAMPESFTAAIIVPLEKAGDRTDATNYRPISLLQSSYKIFTKLLAHRVQKSLGKVINADQNGFVRGRALANNITIMKAILGQPSTSALAVTAEENAAVVLLDFKKAYDTLDRDFVATAMEDFGYSDDFVAIVRRLHLGTTAQFLVNGELSTPFEVVTGIRQGCPLAPLLFLIAVEPLKHAIDQAPGLRGVQLRHQAQSYEHTFSAFVDDSVVFLDRGDMIQALEEVLTTFAAISGLTVQPHKSHVIILHAQCTATTLGSFPVVPVGTTVTYLGVDVGLADLDAVNWDKRCTSIETQLGILSQYTTGVTDRVQVINMASIPSLLFTAQFFTPPRQHQLRLEGLWRQFVWQGTITGAARRSHKIASDIVHLPRTWGGLGMRDYRGAMAAQAATAIIQWNSRTRDKYWAAYHNLLVACDQRSDRAVLVYPSAHVVPATALQTGHNLLTIGLRMVNAALTTRYPHPEGLRLAKVSALGAVTDPWRGLRWLTTQQSSIQLRQRDPAKWTRLAQLNYAQTPSEIKLFWATFPWYDNTWIRGRDGEVLQMNEYSFIHITTLSELQLTRVDDSTYYFRNPAGPVETMHKSTRRRLAEWITIIVANVAALPGQPPLHLTQRVYAATRHPRMDAYEWHLTDGTTMTGIRYADEQTAEADPARGRITAALRAWRDPVNFLNASPAASADLAALQAVNIYMDGHPRLQQGPTMRGATDSTRSLTTPREIVRRWVASPNAAVEKGLQKLVHRLEKQLVAHPIVGAALQTTSATQLARKPWGVSSQQHFLRYRLTLGALNVRDLQGQRMQCPHSFCSTHDVFSVEHVVWTCTAAQAFWTTMIRRWVATTTTILTPEAVARHVFEPSSPPLDATTRRDLHAVSPKDTLISKTIEDVWTVISYCATQQLWLLRNQAAFANVCTTPIEHVRTVLAAVRNQLSALSAVRSDSNDAAVKSRIIDVLADTVMAERQPGASPDANIRLYFDGGSRGNPGITGTGSILVERDTEAAEWRIVWWDAHYLGDDSTNNVAEHTAAKRGLEEACRRYAPTGEHITIIGDSQLVIAQLHGVATAVHHSIRGREVSSLPWPLMLWAHC